MASTTDVYISPADGWVAVATNPDYLIIKAARHTPWYLAISSAGTPSLQATPATGTVTVAVGQPSDGDTVTVGAVTYTFKTALGAPVNEVFIGASNVITAANLVAAIMAASGAGTKYSTGTTANPDVTAVSDGTTTNQVDLTAVAQGSSGNSLVLAKSGANLSVSGTTLTGGVTAFVGALMNADQELFTWESPITGVAYIRVNEVVQPTPGTKSRFTVLVGDPGSGGGTASAVNQTNVQAAPGSDAIKAVAVQGITGGEPVATTVSPIQTDATSRSSTVTTGGTAQDLMAANSSRKGWAVQNQSGAYLYIRSKTVSGSTVATQDQNSFRLDPGQLFESPYVSPYAISIIGPTTGQAFWAREW